MKKKIGIITIIDYNNYGNRLQNYAVQEILKKYEFEVETILNEPNKSIGVSKISEIKRFIYYPLKQKKAVVMEKVWLKKNRDLYEKVIRERKESFIDFTKKYIVETKSSININNIPKDFSDSYDYFITGSDQVWNPNFRYGSSIDFLTFAPSKKRIALSPSFGISEIPEQYTNIYAEWLRDIKYLSVREEAGAKIINKLTQREATVLIDPTLMLNKEKWMEISRVFKNKPKQSYLLIYILGKLNEETKNYIDSFSKTNNLVVFNLADKKEFETYSVGPAEFIDLINDATAFFTDSFHGCIFSIVLNTPFIVFEREDSTKPMNSRLETLLNKFELESRYYKNLKNDTNILDIDFSNVSDILDKEKNKMNHFLEKAFKDGE